MDRTEEAAAHRDACDFTTDFPNQPDEDFPF